jgi:hypothetical protein
MIPGFWIDRLQLKNSTKSTGEVIMIESYGKKDDRPEGYSVYVSGPRKRGRRVKPFAFTTDTLEDLAGQIEREKAKLV